MGADSAHFIIVKVQCCSFHMPSSTPVSCNSKRDPRECYCVAGARVSRTALTRSNINVKVSDLDAAHGTKTKSNAILGLGNNSRPC